MVPKKMSLPGRNNNIISLTCSPRAAYIQDVPPVAISREVINIFKFSFFSQDSQIRGPQLFHLLIEFYFLEKKVKFNNSMF